MALLLKLATGLLLKRLIHYDSDMANQHTISEQEVIDRILDLIKAIPESTEGLPEGYSDSAFWRDLFAANERTRRLMQTYRELPAFTNMAPEPGNADGWRALMIRFYDGPEHFRPNHANQILKHVVN